MFRQLSLAAIIFSTAMVGSVLSQKPVRSAGPKSVPAEAVWLPSVFEWKDANGAQKAESTRLRIEITDDLKALQRVLVEAPENENKNWAECSERLNWNREALSGLSGSNLSVEQRLSVCRAVARDIKIKKAYAEKNPGAPNGPVKVIARTMDGTNEKSGFQVWYVTLGLAADSSKYQHFDRYSSPTERKLNPGAYQMWAKVPTENRCGPKETVSIGEHGAPTQTLDLPAPPQ